MIIVEKFEKKYIESAAIGLVETYKHEPWNEKWSLDDARRRINYFIENKNSFCFVIKENEDIVGYLFAHRDVMSDGDIAYIDELYILKNYQRKGYAKKVLEIVSEKFKDNNISNIELHTIVEDLVFYNKCGFDKCDYIHCVKSLK